jgi:hypothetical protein
VEVEAGRHPACPIVHGVKIAVREERCINQNIAYNVRSYHESIPGGRMGEWGVGLGRVR